MADIKVNLFPLVTDDPTEVVPFSVTFTLETKTSRGGVGRIGRGFIKQVIITAQVIPPITQKQVNYGYVS